MRRIRPGMADRSPFLGHAGIRDVVEMTHQSGTRFLPRNPRGPVLAAAVAALLAMLLANTFSHATPGQPLFTAPWMMYPTGAGSRSIAIGDLNGDGDRDLVTANVSGTISVLLGRGDGSFDDRVDYPTGGNSGSVTLADVNSDGRPDVATAVDPLLVVFLTNPDGSLGTRIDIPDPRWSVADVNGDQASDLVMLRGGSVVARLGNGDGTFGAEILTPTQSPGLGTVGDLNGDGRADLVTVTGNGVLVLRANEDATFTPVFENAFLGSEQNIQSIETGDANGDGVLDLVLAMSGECFRGDCDGWLTTWVGSGDGSFYQGNSPEGGIGGERPRSAMFADLNGDGRDDVLSTWDMGVTFTTLNDGSGAFRTGSAAAWRATDVAIADLDHDGDADMATVSELGAVSVSLGNGNGTFGPGVQPLTFSPGSVASGDLNTDGMMDLVAAYESNWESPASQVFVMLGAASGGFIQLGPIEVGPLPLGVSLGDLNGDGKLDLAVAASMENSVSVLMGDGSGGFGPRSIVPIGQETSFTAIGDFDRDGFGDLVVRGPDLAVFRGHGDGTFGPPTAFEEFPGTVLIQDVDVDGMPDLVFPHGTSVSIMRGDGSGGFLPRTDLAIGQTATQLAAGDLNGDGRRDLVAAGSAGATALLGDGLGNYSVASQTALLGAPGPIAIGDLNGDGIADLALSAGQIVVAAVLGAGDGSFGAPQYFGTSGQRPGWVGIADRNADGHADLTVTNGGLFRSEYYPEGYNFTGYGASIDVLLNTNPAVVNAPGPIPTFTTPVVATPPSIYLGDSITITLSVRNDGLLSDNGRISVSFPSFTFPADGQRVSGAPGGDFPGYVETVAGGALSDVNCDPMTAAYLVAEYVDADWRPIAIETNTLTLAVRPRETGPFYFYVRSTMHNASGAVCDFANGLPAGGEQGYADQQGWTVRRYTVMVEPLPQLPSPAFAPISVAPTTIGLGQTFQIQVAVRNDGFASDDGRIVVGFPSLTNAGDAGLVSGGGAGDSPGYREFPAGSILVDSACAGRTASYLVVEYADNNWAMLGQETNVLTLSVQPDTVGVFRFDIRSTMHVVGGAPCEFVNAVPLSGEVVPRDQQGWSVRQYSVVVLPPPPQPTVSNVVISPSAVIALGRGFTLSTTVTNTGSATNDGRIVVSFPNFASAPDAQWVTQTAGGGDAPGYRELPPGTLIPNPGCNLVATSYLTTEYGDGAWSEDETNEITLTVTPQVLGFFRVNVHSTMRWTEAGGCSFVNGLPANGTTVVDQDGWAARQFVVQVVSASPPPLITSLSGIPLTVVLGEEFTITAVVRNDGPGSDDGRISLGFPVFTGPTDHQWVGGGSSADDHPGYLERAAGTQARDSTCALITTSYLTVEHADSTWSTGESNTLTVRVQPRVSGTFYVDVRATLHDAPSGSCSYLNAFPTGGGTIVLDQQGWPVRRFAITVYGPPGPVPPASVAWEPMTPPGVTGPGARYGGTAVLRAGQDAMMIYGGQNPSYRDDVWSLQLSEGGAWSQITPGGTVPLRRIMHSMIHNPVDDQLVIFGGLYDDFLNDLTVVTLTGQIWWFHDPGQGPPPSIRGGHAAIYDPVRNRMLVIGGFGRELLNDVWEYAPPGVGVWRQLTPLGTPMPPRVQHAAVYDPVRDRVIVIGGDGGFFLNDVWALNLAGDLAWEKLEPTGLPPTGRREHAAIYDPDGDRVVIYGGFDGARRGDLWSLKLDGAAPSWSLLASSTPGPVNRAGHTGIYDPLRKKMVMFGGQTGPNQYSSEVWGLTLDITTPVAISLVSTEVRADVVRLTWSAEQIANLRAIVYRSTGDPAEWEELGSPTIQGEDRLVFEDRDVRPGERYGYRLVVHADGEETTLDPVWVTIPHPAILSLAGASPNPSERGISVRFSLPGAEPAMLELFDLGGRRIAAREVGTLGAGEHLVPLADQPSLAAGVYLVRLTHPQRVLSAKALVVR